MSRLALGPSQPSVHWVLGTLNPGLKDGVKLTVHNHLVLRLKTHGAIPPLPIWLHSVVINETRDMPLWHGIW
jgi:hypothetical protein